MTLAWASAASITSTHWAAYWTKVFHSLFGCVTHFSEFVLKCIISNTSRYQSEVNIRWLSDLEVVHFKYDSQRGEFQSQLQQQPSDKLECAVDLEDTGCCARRQSYHHCFRGTRCKILINFFFFFFIIVNQLKNKLNSEQ